MALGAGHAMSLSWGWVWGCLYIHGNCFCIISKFSDEKSSILEISENRFKISSYLCCDWMIKYRTTI